MIGEIKVTVEGIEDVVVIEEEIQEVMIDLAPEMEGGNEMVLIIHIEEGEESTRTIIEGGIKNNDVEFC
jgi:hypothetical protein